MSENVTPIVSNVRDTGGVAGQVSVKADVQYPGEDAETIEFVGSVYGGPVVMILPSGRQTYVTDPDRHGKFGRQWVRSFFADRG